MTAPRPAHTMTDRDLLFAALGECAVALEATGRAMALAVALAQRAGVLEETTASDAEDDLPHFAGEGRQANARTPNGRA